MVEGSNLVAVTKITQCKRQTPERVAFYVIVVPKIQEICWRVP